MAEYEVEVTVECPHCHKELTTETTVEIEPLDYSDLD